MRSDKMSRAAARWLGLARATVRKMIRKYHPTVDEPEPDDVS